MTLIKISWVMLLNWWTMELNWCLHFPYANLGKIQEGGGEGVSQCFPNQACILERPTFRLLQGKKRLQPIAITISKWNRFHQHKKLIYCVASYYWFLDLKEKEPILGSHYTSPDSIMSETIWQNHCFYNQRHPITPCNQSISTPLPYPSNYWW